MIEKLVYGGDGLARIESEGGRRKTVFVPLVLPGERIEASVIEDRPGFARAQLDRVLEPAPQRTTSPCPYFGQCGGCHHQHATYEAQLELKTQIVRETVARIAKVELPDVTAHASPSLRYRNRTRMKVSPKKVDTASFALGYYRLSSHDLLPVRECPISSPAINRVIQAIWSVATMHELPAGLSEIEFFANDDDTAVLVEFIVEGGEASRLVPFARAVQKEAPEVIGISALPRASATGDAVAAPELAGGPNREALPLFRERSFIYRVGVFEYRIGADAFFQTNRFLIPKLVELVTEGAKGKLALDLYAGAGLFALPLTRTFDRVVAVESSPASVQYLRQNAPSHAKVWEATTESFLEKNKQSPDYVVVDPPRAGLGKRVVAGLVALSPKMLTYVSCDPSTMARDLPALLAAGYRITQAHLVDLFPQTFHIETVLRLER